MSKKILIVDDSKTVRQQIHITLEKEGFEIIDAADGLIGVDKMKEHKDLSLVIIDINMPGMGGLELLNKIKKDELFEGPSIVLTTEGSSEIVQKAKNSGAKAWIVKPFSPDQMLKVVNTLTN